MWSKYEQNPVQITMLLFRLFVGAFIKKMSGLPTGCWQSFQLAPRSNHDLTVVFNQRSNKPASQAGWWYSYPSEKYEFVSWDDYSQYMEK